MLKSLIKPTVLATGLCLCASASFAGKADDTLNIVWGTTGPIENVDAYFNTNRTGIWFTRMVWDQLVYRDPATFEYKPLLATSWEYDDANTIIFKLREGVTFHNGEPFDADDVVFTLNWISKQENGIKVQRNANWIKAARKIDRYTVELETKTPFPQAFEYLSGPVVMYPNEYYAKVGPEGMGEQPIGTGPYKVVSVAAAEQYVFERNDAYNWNSLKGKAKIKTIVVREMGDLQTQVAELLAGSVDFSADISVDHVKQLGGVPGLDSVQAGTMRIMYLGFDAAGRSGFEPITDIRVRQAFAHAIDRETLVKHLVGGNSRVVHTPCYPTQFGCDATAAVEWKYDPGKARQLLADAGFADGLEIEFYTFMPKDLSEAIMGDLAKVGIQAKLSTMPYFPLRDLQWEGKTPSYFMSWGSYSVNDTSAITSHFFKLGPDDFARDEEVAAWLEAGDTNVDPDVRKANYAKAIAKITGQVYWLPLYNSTRNYAFTEDLDFTPYEDEIPRFFRYGWK